MLSPSKLAYDGLDPINENELFAANQGLTSLENDIKNKPCTKKLHMAHIYCSRMTIWDILMPYGYVNRIIHPNSVKEFTGGEKRKKKRISTFMKRTL